MTPSEELHAAAQKIRDIAGVAESCEYSGDAVETIANLWLNDTRAVADLLDAMFEPSPVRFAAALVLARAINGHWLFQPRTPRAGL